MSTIYKPITTRIDTTANWTTLNPTPAYGEQCIEVLGGGLFKLKVGDGVTPWVSLDYYQSTIEGGIKDLITPKNQTLVAAINSVQEQITEMKENVKHAILRKTKWEDNQQTIYMPGATENNAIFLCPTPGSSMLYAASGIMCIEQNIDSLTFICKEVPADNIDINVFLFERKD